MVESGAGTGTSVTGSTGAGVGLRVGASCKCETNKFVSGQPMQEMKARNHTEKEKLLTVGVIVGAQSDAQ